MAQNDSIQLLEVMEVSYLPNININSQVMEVENIQEVAAEDIGELIRKFAGVSLKSYGGLGGLKTVSMRGLGANHSVIVADGFSLSNTQTGQINLGQIQAENVTQFVSVIGSSSRFMQPISAQIGGNSFILETFENAFSTEKLKVRANVKYGSFNQKNGYLGIKYAPNKFQIGIFGMYRDADGNYPYSFQNGSLVVNEVRKNNDYRDFNYGATLGFKGKKITSRIGYKKIHIDQGLPGAVIFYNQTQDERLKTSNDLIFADLVYSLKKFQLRTFVNATGSQMNYLDPTYLNQSGKIDVRYKNRSLTGGVSLNHSWNEKWDLFGGIEYTWSDLKTNDSSFSLPVRSHFYGLLGSRVKLKNVELELNLSTQLVDEKNRNGESAENRFRVNPFGSIRLDLFKRKLVFEIWYRNSFRMPSFNELYYNNIGNNLLKPEDAHQFNLGIGAQPFNKRFKLKLKANAYFNRVENKIVAIPTKNLFVWSMQNVGVTNVYGVESVLNMSWQFRPNWKLQSDANYSYQKTVDVTDKNSPTYGDQIAYIPLHTFNFDVSLHFKKTGIRLSSYFVSDRYALNENVEANRIDGFYIADVSVFHHFEMRKKHTLQLQLNVKNIFNQSYTYIRSYVMPGVNYLITMSYAFN